MRAPAWVRLGGEGGSRAMTNGAGELGPREFKSVIRREVPRERERERERLTDGDR